MFIEEKRSLGLFVVVFFYFFNGNDCINNFSSFFASDYNSGRGQHSTYDHLFHVCDFYILLQAESSERYRGSSEAKQ